jgi:hypothetical protein
LKQGRSFDVRDGSYIFLKVLGMVQFWELTSGGDNNFATLMCQNEDDVWNNFFATDGKPLHWAKVPMVLPVINKKRKKQLPVPDIAWLLPGTIILGQKAYSVLKDFLPQFGQLLALDCAGEASYFYNVTNIVSCIDFDRSEKSSTGKSILKAEFRQEAIPQDVQIFKDPLTASGRIYLTQAAKDALEKLIAENGLTGLRFFEAGKKF